MAFRISGHENRHIDRENRDVVKNRQSDIYKHVLITSLLSNAGAGMGSARLHPNPPPFQDARE